MKYLVLACGLAGSLLADASVEVRVRHTEGGPRLFVDGKAKAPRFVYVSPGNRSLDVSETWRTFDLGFETTPRARNATLHFRFENKDVQVGLRNVAIADETERTVALRGSMSGERSFRECWGVFLEGKDGTVAFTNGETVVSARKPKAWRTDFHLFSKRFPVNPRKRYRLVFEARANRAAQLMPCVYLDEPEDQYVLAPFEGHDVLLEQLRLATEAGIDLVTFPAPCAWKENGYDWMSMDVLIRKILTVNPRALVLPRVGIDAPQWYLKRHPEARARFSDGFEGMGVSIAEPNYRSVACDYAEKTVRHLRETFPNNFAGLHVAALAAGEWIYPKRNSIFYGFDTATRDAFRRWLAKRGDGNAATAEVPSAEDRLRGAEPGYALRDPTKDGKVADFMQFLQDDLVAFMGELGRVVRRGSDGKSLAAFFYGYSWELADRENGPAETGHYGLEKLLREHGDVIDILCAPYSYLNRRWPGSSAAQGPADSIMKSGVLWLTENDTRTYLERIWDAVALGGGPRIDKSQTKQILSRITAFDMVRGYGSWWMDLLGRGWYEDGVLWDELRRLAPLEAQMMERKRPYSPDLACIVDEKGMQALAPGSNFVMAPLSSRYPFDQCGIPYGQYLLNDVLNGSVQAKMQVYSMVFSLTAEQRAVLKRQRLERPGLMRIWCWAPGWISEKGARDSNVEDLTSFRVKRVEIPLCAKVKSTSEGLAEGLRPEWGCGMPGKIRPCFGVETEPGDEVWARYEEDGSAAMVVRKNKVGGYDVFLGTAHFLPEALSALARRAGVHAYAKPLECNVCAAEGVVALQALKEGPITVDFGAKAPVLDLLANAVIGEGPVLSVPFDKGETRVFKIITAN